MKGQNIIIGILVISSFFLKSCATLYVDEDRQDCYPNLIGKWKIYKISNSLGIPSSEKNLKVWVIDSNTIQIEGERVDYRFKYDCSYLALKKNDEGDEVNIKIVEVKNDTLKLGGTSSILESPVISLKRIN